MTVQSTAKQRLISTNVFTAQLDPDPAHPTMQSSSRVLSELPFTKIGLWDAAVGHSEEEEGDEVFVILSGSGILTFDDASFIELAPGVMVRLAAGDRTVWKVTSNLRQLFLA